MPDDPIGYIVTQFFGRGMAAERADFEDKVKAEKAFTDAKNAAILWQSRPVSTGLGWIKLKEKVAPPPAPVPPPGAAKPAVPAAAAAAKPAVPAPVKPAAPVVPAAAPATPVAPVAAMPAAPATATEAKTDTATAPKN